MVTYTTKESLMQALSVLKNGGSQAEKAYKIGFVPTMGALHLGHLSLIQKALEENDKVVVSIFVNPTQFNNSKDLEKYPRNAEKDLTLLEKTTDNLIVYLPQVSDIYGDQVVSIQYDFEGLENQMEGKHRKGHFDGVGTVLTKFFHIIEPDKAYLGEKDFQQLQIVKKLVTTENLPLEIVGCPILREKNGLAMSSRNERLSAEQFEEASVIYEILQEVQKKYNSLSFLELHEIVAERFLQNPNIKLEYFEIANEETLIADEQKNPSTKYRAFVAAFVGDVRLIDNIPLN